MKLLRHLSSIVLVGVLGLLSIGQAQPLSTNLWKVGLAHYDTESSPATGLDGTVYQATFDGNLMALTPAGQIRWTFKTPLQIKSSPAIAEDGTIYFGARDRKLYALTAGGKLKWTFLTGAWIDSSPAIGADGTVYFGSWDRNFYAVKPDGSLKWSLATSNVIVSSPAIAADGTIYFGSHDRNFYALNADGTMRWKFATQGPITSSPAIGAGGTIFFTSMDGNLYALNPDGTEQWRLRTGGFTEASPIVGATGQIYLAVNTSRIAVSAEGRKLWDYGTPCLMDNSPAAAGDRVYFATAWGDLAAFNSRGDRVWAADIGTGVVPKSSLVIGLDDLIYLNEGRNLSAFAITNDAPLAKSSWPMFRANAQHTGRMPAGY